MSRRPISMAGLGRCAFQLRESSAPSSTRSCATRCTTTCARPSPARRWALYQRLYAPIFLEPDSARSSMAWSAPAMSRGSTSGWRPLIPPHRTGMACMPRRGPGQRIWRRTLGAALCFGQDGWRRTVLTNVVYPVRTRGAWIATTPPGAGGIRSIPGLGFIASSIGTGPRARHRLPERLPHRAGEQDAAFIHHGSRCVQLYLFTSCGIARIAGAPGPLFIPPAAVPPLLAAGWAARRRAWGRACCTPGLFYNSAAGMITRPGPRPSRAAGGLRRADGQHGPRHPHGAILRLAAEALGESPRNTTRISPLSAAIQAHAWRNRATCLCAPRERQWVGRSASCATTAGAQLWTWASTAPTPGGRHLQPGPGGPADRALMSPGRSGRLRPLHRGPIGALFYRPDGYWNGAVWILPVVFWRALLTWAALRRPIACPHGPGLWSREVETLTTA